MMAWLIRLPLLILIVLLRYPLAPILVLFREDRQGALNNNSGYGIEPRLPLWLSWFDTQDASLYGDDGHKERVGDFTAYWSMVRWLWRNGGHDFNYTVIGCPHLTMPVRAEAPIDPGYEAQRYWERPDGYWLYRRFIPIGSKKLELFFGWNLFGQVRGRCKYVCQVRIK